MKKILCDNPSCIHNESTNILGHSFLVCMRCDDIKVNSYHDTCDGYESREAYLKRTNPYNDSTNSKTLTIDDFTESLEAMKSTLTTYLIVHPSNRKAIQELNLDSNYQVIYTILAKKTEILLLNHEQYQRLFNSCNKYF